MRSDRETRTGDEDAKARQLAEGMVKSLLATVEEARNHLMDARSAIDDKATIQASLDAIDDLLGRAEETARRDPLTDELGVAMTAGFLREANHAIRGTLGSAVSHLELLRDRLDLDAEQVRRSIQAAWEAGATADRFVQEFFDIAGAWAQGPIVPIHGVSIAALLKEVVDGSDAHANSRRVKLRTQIASDARRARVDADGFQEMVEMMLEHAIQAAPPGSEVTVRAAAPDGALRLEVRHDGKCPWSPTRHFQPFEPVMPDAPIALSALSELASLRAGQAGVETLEPRGETLWVRLPQWDEEKRDEAAPTKVEETVPAPQTSDAPRVLVVEDDNTEREHLRGMLEAAGYAVAIANNVDQAVQIVEQQTFRAITLDLLLGRNYSTRVLAAARAGRNADAAVLVLSATRPGNVAFPFPVQGHLQKPVSKRTLLRALRWSGVPPPIGGPVLVLGDVDAAIEEGAQRLGRRVLLAKDAAQAQEMLDEDPVVVVADPTLGLSNEFLDSLEGAALLLWGDKNKARARIRHAASATVAADAPAEELLNAIERLLEEQASMTSLEGGPF